MQFHTHINQILVHLKSQTLATLVSQTDDKCDKKNSVQKVIIYIKAEKNIPLGKPFI